jgi:hypothetical protein
MLLEKMTVQTEESTSMACFYLCTIGILKNQIEIEYPLWTFFKDWSFQKTRYAAFTDFDKSKEILEIVDGIQIKNHSAATIDEMLSKEKKLVEGGLQIICSVDTYHLPHHPFYNSKHSGHFVVLTKIEDGNVCYVDVELRKTGVFSIKEWCNIRSYAENAKSIDLFTVKYFPGYNNMSPVSEFEYVSNKNIQTMRGYLGTRGGLQEMHEIEEAMRSYDESSLSMFMNHYGMRTARMQHGKYLKQLSEKTQNYCLSELADTFFVLSKEWGKLHLICSKFQFKKDKKCINQAATQMNKIHLMEESVLRKLEQMVKEN